MMTSHEINAGAAEQARRYNAQRRLDLGFWADRNRNALKLAQTVLTDAHFAWIDDENSSQEADEIFMQIGDAIDAICEVVAELRRVNYGEALPSPNQLIVRHKCGHDQVIELPPIGGAPELPPSDG